MHHAYCQIDHFLVNFSYSFTFVLFECDKKETQTNSCSKNCLHISYFTTLGFRPMGDLYLCHSKYRNSAKYFLLHQVCIVCIHQISLSLPHKNSAVQIHISKLIKFVFLPSPNIFTYKISKFYEIHVNSSNMYCYLIQQAF